MIFSLDVRRAKKGDCLLLHYGTPERPGLVLIDGGPKSVYAPHLRPRLMEIRQKRELPDNRPLTIDLLMVSHVDDDHIQGILDLTQELRDAPGVPIAKIKRMWHNSFDEVVDRDPEELTAKVAAGFGAAALEGGLPDDAMVDGSTEDDEVVKSTLKVLASIPQGHKLRRDAAALNVELNSAFDGKLILAAAAETKLTDELSFVTVGPLKREAQALQDKHDAWLKQLAREGKTVDEALAAYADKSVTNLSSLVFIVRAGGKSMLLTGDARGDRILAGLETIGALAAGQSMHVDVLKVPHHGSANNLEVGFFKRITADHYVFSGNGEHGNPERGAFEMLFAARPTASFKLHITYPIDEIDPERKRDWEREQRRERADNVERRAQGKPEKPVREDWSDATNSLTAFFQQQPLRPGQTMHIVPPTAPHVIDLLDPIGF